MHNIQEVSHTCQTKRSALQDKAKHFCRIYANFAGHLILNICSLLVLATILAHQDKNAGFTKFMQDKVLSCRTILQILGQLASMVSITK